MGPTEGDTLPQWVGQLSLNSQKKRTQAFGICELDLDFECEIDWEGSVPLSIIYWQVLCIQAGRLVAPVLRYPALASLIPPTQGKGFSMQPTSYAVVLFVSNNSTCVCDLQHTKQLCIKLSSVMLE